MVKLGEEWDPTTAFQTLVTKVQDIQKFATYGWRSIAGVDITNVLYTVIYNIDAYHVEIIQLVTRLDVCVSSLRRGHAKRIEAAVQQCILDSERTITGIKGFELIPKPSSEFEMVIELARTND